MYIYRKGIKRLLDIVFSLIGMPFLGVSFIIVAPCIYGDDKGPIFYTAPRVGYKGRTFLMYKYRSMKVNAPDIRNEDGSTFNSENDPRVTRIGKLLRKTSVDELPQLLNVLKGDMSFVGPRPNLPSVPYEELPLIEQQRLQARPGITGYNQAYYRNSVSSEEKFRNDVYYVKNVSFKLDVKILVKTVSTVIKKDHINTN